MFSIFFEVGAVGTLFGVGSGEGALEEVPRDVLVSLFACPLVERAPDSGEGDAVGLFPFELAHGVRMTDSLFVRSEKISLVRGMKSTWLAPGVAYSR